MSKIVTKLIMSLAIFLSLSTNSKAHKVEIGAVWVQLEQNLWLGVHCLIADGSAQTFMKSLGLPLKLVESIIVGKLIDAVLARTTLNEGDTYCIYMHTTRKFGNDFDRRELIMSTSRQRRAVSSEWNIALYDKGQKKHHSYTAQDCINRSRCFTKIISGNKNTSGFAVCVETKLTNNKKISVVLRFGEVTGKRETGGKPEKKEQACADRQEEFLDVPATTSPTPKT